ncbi:signal transducer and activator of transcription 6 isoform X2 [Engraulis encrasicolus]|uniref:signal transducer and activator of transcription 6 isoform X2 n=1 Tax=Engraulis encrasicolus TaxID=184585 RepID=UPI002FD55319
MATPRLHCVTMAQWEQMKLLATQLPQEMLSELYPGVLFPMDVRHYLAAWIEEQPWDRLEADNVEQAQVLRDQISDLLREQANQHQNVLERLRLQDFSRKMSNVQPMPLVQTVRDTLRKESEFLSLARVPMVGHYHPTPCQTGQLGGLHQPGLSQSPRPPNGLQALGRPEGTQDMDNLVLKVLEIRRYRQEMHQLQEEVNWERQNDSMSSPMQGSCEPDPQQLEKQKRIQALECKYRDFGKTRVQLLHETIAMLAECQKKLVQRIKDWRWEQHQATIGGPFNENLGPLQTWCEQLLGVNVQLRQEVILVGQDHGSPEPFADLQERLVMLLKTLIQSSMVVDKQPPQVIKTQSKFSTTVRYLLGEKVATGKPILLRAQIVTELQARNLGQPGGIATENVGELINSTAILEHNPNSKTMCANFRNMSIKKIKRADRKGSESVTEEKFAILFTADIAITGCDHTYGVQTITLPVVVIVHGSQDNNAMATIVWDCAFSEPNRIPFVVPERVPWRQMAVTLSRKFMTEVGTQRPLDDNNLHFLAQKIFNKPDISEDFSNLLVTWSQFNKEVLPGRPFTFWQWFDGVTELTKKHLAEYWTDGLIFGFIGKQHLHVILQNKPNGTFLLRFSDSEIGGITIAYVTQTETGVRKIQNIQPFTKRDLEIRRLGDRIRDLDFITQVYPDMPKNDVFGKYYTDMPGPVQPSPGGYLRVDLTTTVVGAVEHPREDMQMSTFPPQAAQFPGSMAFQPDFSPPTPCPLFPNPFDNLAMASMANIPPQPVEAESMLDIPDDIYDFNANM